MNTSNTDTTPPTTPSDKQDLSTPALTGKPREARPSEATQELIKRMVAGLNRMAVDEDFRKEIEKKIF